MLTYFVHCTIVFFNPKISQKSRSILKEKTPSFIELHWTELQIWGNVVRRNVLANNCGIYDAFNYGMPIYILQINNFFSFLGKICQCAFSKLYQALLEE